MVNHKFSGGLLYYPRRVGKSRFLLFVVFVRVLSTPAPFCLLCVFGGFLRIPVFGVVVFVQKGVVRLLGSWVLVFFVFFVPPFFFTGRLRPVRFLGWGF